MNLVKMNVKYFVLALFLFSGIHLREFFTAGIAEVMLLAVFLPFIHCKNLKSLYVIVFLSSLLVFLILFSYLNSSGLYGIRYTAMVLYGVLLMLFLAFSNEDFFYVLKWFAYLSVFVSLFAVLSMVLFYLGSSLFNDYLYIRGSYARANGFLQGPNYYAISAFFAFVTSFYLWRFGTLSLLIVLFNFFGMAATLSRGALLAFCVFILSVVLVDRRGVVKFIFAIIAPICALVFLASFGLIGAESWSQFMSVLERRFSDGGGGGSSRIESISNTFLTMDLKGWLIGSGRYDYSFFGIEEPPHNVFVTIIADNGLFSFLTLLLLMGYVCFVSLHIPKKVSVYNLSLVLSCFALGVTNDYQFTREWWLLIGLALFIFGHSYRFEVNEGKAFVMTRQNQLRLPRQC